MADDRDDEMEKADEVHCPICLLLLSDRDVGTPECCDHDFCLRCILEWSKLKNTCPNDRQVFHIIFARHHVGGDIYENIQVADAELPNDEDVGEDEEPTYCEICRECHNEESLLLCDHCDNGYHLYCLTPALNTVPNDDWYCPDCAASRSPQQPSTSATVRERGSTIPRTRANMRIYRRVANVIISSSESSESESEGGQQAAGDSDVDEDALSLPPPDLPAVRRSSSPNARRKSVKRKSKTTRKRKSSSRRRSGRKRKVMKRRFTSRRKKTSIRQRLAGKLGMVAPPPGCSIPRIVNKPAVGNSNEVELSVFGDSNAGGFHMTSAMSKPQKIVINLKQSSKAPTHIPSEHKSSSTDLLGDILDGQSMLRTSSKDIEITKEGILKLKPSSSMSSLEGHSAPSSSSPSTPSHKATSPSSPHKTTPLRKAISPSALSNGVTSSRSPVKNHSSKQGSLRQAKRSSTMMKTDLTNRALATLAETSSSKSKRDQNRMYGLELKNNKSSGSNSLENIPLPTGSPDIEISDPSKGMDSDLGATDISLDNIPLPDQPCKKSSGVNALLRGYDHMRPEKPLLTACTVYIKMEGRAAYDSRDRDSIRDWYTREHDEVSGDLELDYGSDDEILVLTPPPRSPESVVCVSTDSEDERNNINRPPKPKKLPAQDTLVYSISSDSESDTRKRKRRSRSSSRRRSYRSGHRSPNRKRQRSRSRSRQKSINRSNPRHINRRRSRSRLQNDSLHNSRPRSRSPVRKRHTPVRNRYGHRLDERDHRRGRHVRSPSPPKSRRSRILKSPSKRNGTWSPSRSPHRRHRSRKYSRSPEKSKQKKPVSPILSSISPDRLRRDYEKARKYKARESSIGSRLCGTSQTLASELEKNLFKVHDEDKLHEEEEGELVPTKSRSKKKSRSESRKKKRTKKSRDGYTDKVAIAKKKKKHSKKSKESEPDSEEEEQLQETSKGFSDDARSSNGDESRAASSHSSESLSKQPWEADEPAAEQNVLYSPSEEVKGGDRSPAVCNNGNSGRITEDDEGSPKQMVIDMGDTSDHVTPKDNGYNSPLEEHHVSPMQSPQNSPTHSTPSPAQMSPEPSPVHQEYDHEPEPTTSSVNVKPKSLSGDSPYSPYDSGGEVDAEKLAETQALQIIELLKNEVAEPDIAPPAQPPKSVSQQPRVLSWIAETNIPSSKEATPPAVTHSQSVTDYDLPASATELSNKQAIAKMVGKERIADEIKIVLKPFYCTGKIDKEEYKHIMKNCVSKIYHRSAGKVNPAKVKEFVEKYTGSVIARRKRHR